MKLFLVLIFSLAAISFAEDTGSDKDFEGAETVMPKQEVKTLDNIQYVENYADYSEFQEGDDAEEAEAEAFFHMGRMFGIAVDVGAAGFTQGYSEMNDPALRYGIRATYFFSLSVAMELSFHYQKHAFHIYDGEVNGYEGTNKMLSTALGGKYYIDTRHWSDFISWINPHFYLGVETIQVTIDAPYGPVESNKSYNIDKRIFAATAGMGFEFQMTSMTYFGINGKYHYADYPDEGLYQLDYSFSGDMWSFDASIIFYF